METCSVAVLHSGLHLGTHQAAQTHKQADQLRYGKWKRMRTAAAQVNNGGARESVEQHFAAPPVTPKTSRARLPPKCDAWK